MAQSAAASAAQVQPQAPSLVLTPAQLFQFADAARDRGDFAVAEQAYRALTTNPDIEIRSESRFRLLAPMLWSSRRNGESARSRAVSNE